MLEDSIDRSLLIRIFLDESEESLAAMEQSLVALEQSPGDAETLHTIFRGAHTLKGNAATLGFDGIVELAHMAENLLDALRAGQMAATPGLISLLLSCVDALETMLGAVAADSDASPHPDASLLEALQSAVLHGDYQPVQNDSAVIPFPREKRTETLRVGLRKLDAMMNLAGEMAIARGRLRTLLDGRQVAEAANALDVLDRLSNELQELVTGVRMVPLGPVFQQQVRLARDVSRAAGKSVQLRFEGEDVELDTAVIDQIRDPLVHMVRNAIDHGIETPERRAAHGKPPTGTIVLRAFRDGGMVGIEVGDDGAGLDTRAIAKRARRMNLMRDDEELSKERIDALIFAPGFSTAAAVTEVSGRGVGMDVVHRNITALRGTISVDSTEGVGTTVTVRLPLTLAIIDALAVSAGDQTYVVAVDSVVECLDMPDANLPSGDTGVLDVRGQAVPFVRLSASLGVAPVASARRNLLLVRDGDRQVGVVVDRVQGRTQAVIKPLWKPLPRMQAVAGATILGNGSVALIVDLPRILRRQLKEAV